MLNYYVVNKYILEDPSFLKLGSGKSVPGCPTYFNGLWLSEDLLCLQQVHDGWLFFHVVVLGLQPNFLLMFVSLGRWFDINAIWLTVPLNHNSKLAHISM